jgi:hypothetical protein
MADHADHTDQALLTQIREMWEHADPMPGDLPDRIIAAIAAEDLDFELLTLTASDALAVRGGDAQVLECAVDGVTLVVRVSDETDGSRRIDGWTEGVREVDLLAETGTRTTPVTDAGRFEFDDVPTGPVRLRLHTSGRGFETTEFEV